MSTCPVIQHRSILPYAAARHAVPEYVWILLLSYFIKFVLAASFKSCASDVAILGMALIEVNELTKTYRTGDVATPVLRGVSFTIEEGEFVSIMGPSGSGKSTLLHILGFLDRPTDGHYLFNETPTETLSEDEAARIRNESIGFVFQAFHLLSRATVLENVMLPLSYSRIPAHEHATRAKEALERVQMTHRLYHQPSQLSGGEKQRVAIARALINRPKLVFADEPTGNLDSKTGKIVMDMIDNLHREGHTVILITHETPTAEYADRIIHIHDGQISSDRQVRAPHGHYTK